MTMMMMIIHKTSQQRAAVYKSLYPTFFTFTFYSVIYQKQPLSLLTCHIFKAPIYLLKQVVPFRLYSDLTCEGVITTVRVNMNLD